MRRRIAMFTLSGADDIIGNSVERYKICKYLMYKYTYMHVQIVVLSQASTENSINNTTNEIDTAHQESPFHKYCRMTDFTDADPLPTFHVERSNVHAD